MRTDNYNTLKGISAKNRRRGLKAHQTRMHRQNEILSGFLAFAENERLRKEHETETFGGRVERKILRTPLDASMGEPQVISFAQAVRECSCYARVSATDAEVNERQVRYLMTLEGKFAVASLEGVLAELFDAGCVITNRRNKWLGDTATYQIYEHIVS